MSMDEMRAAFAEQMRSDFRLENVTPSELIKTYPGTWKRWQACWTLATARAAKICDDRCEQYVKRNAELKLPSLYELANEAQHCAMAIRAEDKHE